jgi:hypothetical protein
LQEQASEIFDGGKPEAQAEADLKAFHTKIGQLTLKNTI